MLDSAGLNLACVVVSVLVARTKSRKKHVQAGSAKIKTGGCLAGIEKNRGRHLPGTWVLMITRPKTGVGAYPGVGANPGIPYFFVP